MKTAASIDVVSEGDSQQKLWRLVLAVAALHFLIIGLIQYGLPQFPNKKLSEITIEFGGVVVRGSGGDGVSQAVSATKKTETKKSAVQDDLSTNKATKEQTSTPTQPTASAAPAGVEAAPMVDADYKAAYLNNPKPPYPSVVFQMRIQGTVMLKALVLPDGTCGDVVLAKSSGNSLLDESALKTVAQWKFTPAKAHGKEVSQWVSIPIAFTIKRN